jgi:hypothetical protein
MSYIHLPPGRERRLAYSNARRYNSSNITQQSDSHEITFGTIRSRYRLPNTPQFTHSEPMTFEILSELENVKIGLISNNLVNNSTIQQSKHLSFCTICQQDIFLDIIRTLKCKHHFHINCIDKWFIENKICPQCRYNLDNN